ncbi:unnamed protein product [Leptosia nina]|uniref:TIR domain-containing protein n=1 Tax=Leptosia nina TaxID=320188 RepID=A0AAV1JAT1_9NEOP
MILRIVVICIIKTTLVDAVRRPVDAPICLTGYMTDLQSWVDGDGKLKVNDSAAIDLSHLANITSLIQEHMVTNGRTTNTIRYLSVAKCQLRQVPPIFSLQGALSKTLADSVQYVSFYGNNFGKIQEVGAYQALINATGAKEITARHSHGVEKIQSWTAGLSNVTFRSLLQLDLRFCSIDALEGFIFSGMPSLTHLYLGENKLTFIDANAFAGLTSIQHIDLSGNVYIDEKSPTRSLTFESTDTFANLNLTSLDLSFTTLSTRHTPLLSRLGNKLEILSICNTAIFRLRKDTFKGLPLKYLDISGNPDVLFDPNVLRGLEDTLQVLFANSILLKSLDFLRNFRKLEILQVSKNEISNFPKHSMSTLENLQVLDLARNRISSWFEPIVSTMPRLKLLSLEMNNINVVSEIMIDDMSQVQYLAFSKNGMICNCFTREMYEIALQSERRLNQTNLYRIAQDDGLFHRGYLEYNRMITDRHNLTSPCLEIADITLRSKCLTGLTTNVTGNFLLLDFNGDNYNCLSLSSGIMIPLHEVSTCSQDMRDMPEDLIVATQNNLFLLLIILVLFPIVAFVYVFRRNLRYFLITMRNSAMLSLICEKDMSKNESQIFNYDVFVSYCNEDRAWVLDHLLPHVEIDCNISVCLHERDFQVGLSILENIVSCMDRSRSIMLIISKRFLLSQWCQFEMHLAQHRLLETRREDLILILLEEIPRRLRPNTLHYLMLTKTYIVWPKDESDRKEFWRRMKRSLVTQKLKSVENDSLA